MLPETAYNFLSKDRLEISMRRKPCWSNTPVWLFFFFKVHDFFERQRQSSHVLVCTSKTVATRTGLGWSWEPRVPSRSPTGWQGCNCLSHHLLPPRRYISRNLESGTRAGSQTLALSHETQASQLLGQMPFLLAIHIRPRKNHKFLGNSRQKMYTFNLLT